MKLADLVVHVDSGDLSEGALDVAVALALAHRARLTGLFAESASIGASLVGRRDPDQVVKAIARAREIVEERARRAGVESGWLERRCDTYGDLVDWTVQCCRYADLAVFARHGPGSRAPADLHEQVAALSGRPVLVVPPQARGRTLGRRALVAWTGNRAATRALHDALPLLERAEQVTVLSLQLPSDERGAFPPLDVAAHLRRHGATASYERVIVGELGMADHVLNRSLELEADLVVVGAADPHPLPRLHADDGAGAIVRASPVPVLLSA